MPILGSPAIGRQLSSLSTLLQRNPDLSPHSDPGLSATLMPGQNELGTSPQKMDPSTLGAMGTSFQPEYLSPFDVPQKQKPGDLFGGYQSNPLGGPSSQLAQPGSISSLGGDWAGVDRWASSIASAAAQTGVDPNLIKAVMKLESNGDPNAAGSAGVWGPMQVNSNAWGDGPWMSDPNANILKGAQILKYYLDANGGDMREALRGYHGYGFDGYTSDTQYADTVLGNYSQLQQGGGESQVAPIGGLWGGNPQGHSIVSIAEQYLGTPYVWGAIPGKGDDPSSGWDCSGFTYWLDQNYGSGQLPMGSHYQYQYAQQTGSLFSDTSQLQPGDLIFFDTGWQGGAGAEMNNAGHVAMYIGNGQIIHAANPEQGTVISQLSGYYMDRFLGAMHGSFGNVGVGGYQGGQPQSNPGGSFVDSIRNAMRRNP